MRRCWKRLMKSHKGFTLVELICTIAIFSIVITGVGTAMVVSARSYQRGNVELDLQQQAQITSNLLTNLIIDSDRVVQADGNTLIVEKVESGSTIVYQVYLDGSNIMYITSANTEPHILAENVQDFSVRQDVGGNVDFALKITDAGNTRNYESDYHVTPRNGITSGGSAMSGTASLFVENKIILEPGQTYDLNVRVMGTSVRGFGIEGLSGNTDAAGTTVTVLDDSTARITVGLGETSDTFHFQVKSDDAAVAPQNVDVLVRRVNAIYVNGFKIDGTVNKTGANYKVTAPLAGTNLDREPGAWYDVDYVNPYAVDWSFAFTKEDDNGHITMPNAMDYIEVTGQGMDGKVPYVTFRLKQNMTQGCALKVTATAVHPEGQYPVGSSVMTNKSGEKYGTVSGSWELEYQAWRRNGKLDITVPLTERDFWIYDNGTSLYKHTASVSFVGYNSLGIKTEEQTFNPWTGSQNALLNIEIPPMSHIEQVWNLILNVSTDSGDANGFYNLQAYSSPYHAAVTVDQWEENGKLPSQTYGYFQRYHVASIVIKVTTTRTVTMAEPALLSLCFFVSHRISLRLLPSCSLCRGLIYDGSFQGIQRILAGKSALIDCDFNVIHDLPVPHCLQGHGSGQGRGGIAHSGVVCISRSISDPMITGTASEYMDFGIHYGACVAAQHHIQIIIIDIRPVQMQIHFIHIFRRGQSGIADSQILLLINIAFYIRIGTIVDIDMVLPDAYRGIRSRQSRNGRNIPVSRIIVQIQTFQRRCLIKNLFGDAVVIG